MRRFVAAAVLAVTAVGTVASAQSDPPEPPIDHVSVLPGEGLWSVASRLCPHAVNVQFQALLQANPWVAVTGLDPGTVLHWESSTCPPVSTTSSSTSSTSTTSASSTTPNVSSTTTLVSTSAPTTSTAPQSSTSAPPSTTGSTSTSTTVPLPGLLFPNPDTTGPRSSCTNPQVLNGSQTTTANGQVISCAVIHGNLTIRHNNVTVRDVTVIGVARYMILVESTTGASNGPCPTNVRVEYTEVDASQVAADLIPVYARCGATFDHLYVHGGGAGVRLISNSTVTESYVHTSRRLGDQHRTALSMHGGINNQVIHNTLHCERPAGVTSGSGGCSAALSIYGDFALPDGFLAQNNLLIAAGGYCMYGGVGSPESNAFPDGANIDIIGNHFSTRYNTQCGIYGALAAYTVGVRGNECRGNVFHESGQPMTQRGCTP